MPVSLPTPEQLKKIAAHMNLSLTDADIASFLALMKPSIDGYNVVDALPDNLPVVKYPRTPGVRPQQPSPAGGVPPVGHGGDCRQGHRGRIENRRRR